MLETERMPSFPFRPLRSYERGLDKGIVLPPSHHRMTRGLVHALERILPPSTVACRHLLLFVFDKGALPHQVDDDEEACRRVADHDDYVGAAYDDGESLPGGDGSSSGEFILAHLHDHARLEANVGGLDSRNEAHEAVDLMPCDHETLATEHEDAG